MVHVWKAYIHTIWYQYICFFCIQQGTWNNLIMRKKITNKNSLSPLRMAFQIFFTASYFFFLFPSNEKLFTCQRKPNMTMFFHVMLEWLGQNRFYFCSFNLVSLNVQFSKDIELERNLMQYLQFHLKAQRNLQICKMAQVCPASQKL